MARQWKGSIRNYLTALALSVIMGTMSHPRHQEEPLMQSQRSDQPHNTLAHTEADESPDERAHDALNAQEQRGSERIPTSFRPADELLSEAPATPDTQRPCHGDVWERGRPDDELEAALDGDNPEPPLLGRNLTPRGE